MNRRRFDLVSIVGIGGAYLFIVCLYTSPAESVPDIAHHTANLLKHYWESDPRWSEFTRRMSETAAKLRQTAAAHLMAPKLRNKARFMSVGSMVQSE